MPSFRFNRAFGIAGDTKTSLSRKSGLTRSLLPNTELARHRQELAQVQKKLRVATKPEERKELKKRKKKLQQELFRLKRKSHAARDATKGTPGELAVPRAEDGSKRGALPDFAIIGVKKGGTTFLYHLLSQHPQVEPASSKELHFFDTLYKEGIEWYRRCFPTARWKDGHKTITGEATPYMPGRHIPERMAKVVPQVRLIALLRNPVDRAYSRYHQAVRRGLETRTFEEAVEAEKVELLGTSQPEYRFDVSGGAFGYLYMGFYADHLKHWAEFFSEEQLLVLKSEDLFERPVDTLQVVLDFLSLPEWEPEASKLQRKRNTRKYEKMNPVTRRRLEEYFEPHNRRLYDFLGVDLGW